ncbi:TlpA family protein disulfide reductase [Mucilaginibacter sp. RS28]|uniref:TlpA family protein disulfide reductase n=1 Tax=Mucilaginibacter straminoryzae TaxID=2932774 RepID=A0A9X2B737_9SPHI|nr:TlpA disulfide reductase family protein [Mucilaginibacter straminoryzae]MCJ8208094.1 TlpA family protein disulfide reductase [Mucilaginibacter straminoryzae]
MNTKLYTLYILALVIFLTSLVFTRSYAQTRKKLVTTITVHFQSPPPVDSLEAIYVDRQSLVYDVIKKCKPIKDNVCTLILTLSHPELVSLGYDTFSLFETNESYYGSFATMIEPGDHLTLEVGKNFNLGIRNVQFFGKGSEKLSMLHDFIKSIGMKPGKFPISMNLHELFQRADSNQVEFTAILNKYKDSISNTSFTFYKSFWTANNYIPAFTRLARQKERPDSLYKNFSLVVNAAKISERLVVQSTWEEIADIADINYGRKENIAIEKFYGSKATNTWQHYLNLKALYPGEPLNQSLCTAFIIHRMKAKGVDQQLQQCVSDFLITKWPDQQKFSAAQRFFSAYNKKTKAGLPVLSLALKDTTGKFRYLTDYKGKVVVVDFFFNGCAGCVSERPFLDSLRKVYNTKDVAFVAISTDRSETLWKKGIGKFTLKDADQLYTNGEGYNHPFIRYYEIYSYPTLMLIDKNSNVVTARGAEIRSADGWNTFTKMINTELSK